MTWTLIGPATHESIVRNSVFRAHAMPIADEGAAMAFLTEVAVPDATHNCWAFRAGDRYRSSDDGEPSGTAGRPILSAIEGQDFDGVMLVVTRWYGGVKLGAGGLVRAYGGAASACLREAPRIERIETLSLGFLCSFADYALINSRLAGWRAEKHACTFEADGVEMEVAVPVEDAEVIEAYLRDLSRGRMDVRRI